MKILFINSCVRGKDISRSYKLANEFIKEIKKIDNDIELEEVDLMEINPPYMTYSNFSKREELISSSSYDNPIFDLARQFLEADRIIIAAPYWEYSFPAVLKAYIENISVAGLTFKYSETGSIGLCKAKKMMYITTRGGFATGEFSWMENGAKYLQDLCHLYGIEQFNSIAVEGIDIFGADVEGLLEAAFKRAREEAKSFVDSK